MTGMNETPSNTDVSETCTGDETGDHPFHAESIDPKQSLPFIAPTNVELFQEVVKEFANAERRMKVVEWLDGTDVPSINELRYVGYHLFKACKYQDQDKTGQQYEELKRAERHCKRASYDATELGVINQFERLKEFQNDYKDFPVSDVINDYTEILHEMEEIRSFFLNTAGVEERDEYYDECEKHLKRLISTNKKLNACRDEINIKRTQAKKSSIISVSNLVVTFLALIVGAFGGMKFSETQQNNTQSKAHAEIQTQKQSDAPLQKKSSSNNQPEEQGLSQGLRNK